MRVAGAVLITQHWAAGLALAVAGAAAALGAAWRERGAEGRRERG